MPNQIKVSKIGIFFLTIFFIAFVALQFWQYRIPVKKVFLNGEILNVWLPKTIQQRYKGLGGRNKLEQNQGMLFLFEFPGQHGIVMRDMNFPIDIIWLDKGEVVDIAPSVEPEDVPEEQLRVYTPRIDSTMVLELQSGWAVAHDLKIGDKMSLVED